MENNVERERGKKIALEKKCIKIRKKVCSKGKKLKKNK